MQVVGVEPSDTRDIEVDRFFDGTTSGCELESIYISATSTSNGKGLPETGAMRGGTDVYW